MKNLAGIGYGLQFMLRVMTVLLLVFVLTMIAVVQPRTKASPGPVAGDIVVEAHWPPTANADVDLWVRAPQDVMPVGYSRRSDRQSGYVRDDVGDQNDPSGANYETVFIRTRSAGPYVCNLHAYDLRGQAPVTVRVVVTAVGSSGDRGVIAVADVVLKENGEERTAVAFEVVSGRFVNVRVSPQETVLLRNSSDAH